MKDKLHKFIAQNKEIIQAVNQLPDKHQQAFAVSCCGRLVESCSVLPLIYKTDIHNQVKEVITLLWDHLDPKPLTQAMMKQLINDLEKTAKESKALPSTIYSDLALETVRALQSALDICMDMSTNGVEDVADIVFHALVQYLRSVNYPSTGFLPSDEQEHFDNWLWEAPLLLAELRIQRRDLELLQRNPKWSGTIVVQLRSPEEQIGINPIGNGLVLSSGLNSDKEASTSR